MKSVKTLALTFAMLLAVSTFALAAGKTGAGQSSTSGTSQYGKQQSGQGAMGAQAGQTISATVQEVDQQDNKITLQMQDGESVELQVPQEMLTNLQQGDSVEVSIQKSQKGQSGMGTQSGQTGGTTYPKSQ